MKLVSLLLSLLLPGALMAQTYLSEKFGSSSMPKTFTIINADGLELQPNIYGNIGNDQMVAWTPRQLPGGYGRAAFAPTRKTKEDAPTSAWMILPSLHIADAGAVIRWEARSLHKHYPESYRLAVRKTGTDDWATLYSCDGESYTFATHIVSLDEYLGQDVELAFEATTVHGFILAIDNIYVGIPDDHPVSFDSNTLHYVGDGEKVRVAGTLTYYGNLSPWSELILEGFGQTQSMSIPQLRAGEEIEVEYDVYPSLGSDYRYSLSLVEGQDTTAVYSDFMSCSYYRSHKLVDRLSGTWCNNCPPMEITTSRLERLYGAQLTIVEAHIRDMLSNNEYWTDYLGANVYAIPALIANHNLGNVIYSIKSTDDLSASLAKETIAKIEAEASVDETNASAVHVTSTATFALDIDNSDNRYRVAYMLVGDVHDRYNGFYLQTSSPSSFNAEQYYYQPSTILPEMMYFENLPLDATVAYRGLPSSLPAEIKIGEEYTHTYTLTIPASPIATNIKAIAMVIDTLNNTIINCAVSTINGESGIADIIADDRCSGSVTEYFDIYGRKVSANTHGLIIRREGKNITKTINR